MGLIGVAVSIYFGLNGLTKRITSLTERVATKYDILAMLYAFSKSSIERRPISVDYLKEGYELAKNLLGEGRSRPA